jgi:hypothetical protein
MYNIKIGEVNLPYLLNERMIIMSTGKRGNPNFGKKKNEDVNESVELNVDEITNETTELVKEIAEQKYDIDVQLNKVNSNIRRKAITIDRNEMIPCRSLVNGRLQYVSTRTGLMTVWNDFGTIEYMEYGEILTLRASQPKFLNKPWIIIEDEEVVNSIGGLKEMYEKLSDIGNIETFFNKQPKDFEETFVKLPSGAKSLVATKAREKIENETLFDTRIINIIDKYLETGLKDLIK